MLCPFSRLTILFHLFLHRGGGWCFIGCSHRLPCLWLREALLQNTHMYYMCVYIRIYIYIYTYIQHTHIYIITHVLLYIYTYCYVICGVNSVTRIPDIIQLVGIWHNSMIRSLWLVCTVSKFCLVALPGFAKVTTSSKPVWRSATAGVPKIP